MESVSSKVLEQAIALLGNPNLSQEEVESKLRAEGVKEITAQRLTSFIPEAFGMVAALHMKRKPSFQPTFSAHDEKGESKNIPFSSEPIFGLATSQAEAMHREGSRQIFEAVSKRSSVTDVIQDALDKKSFYDGVIVAIESEVPAEVYREDRSQLHDTGRAGTGEIPLWKRMLRDLAAIEVER